MNLFLFLFIFSIFCLKNHISPAIFFEDFFSVIKYITHFLKMSITFVKEFVLSLTLFSLDYTGSRKDTVFLLFFFVCFKYCI